MELEKYIKQFVESISNETLFDLNFPTEVGQSESGRNLGQLLDFCQQESSKRQEAQARFKGVMGAMLDSLLIIDERGIIQFANAATLNIFGYREDELLGRNISMLMPEPYHSEHDSYLHNYVTTGVKKVIGVGREVQAKRKDGSTFEAHLAVGEISDGSQRYFTGILKDISKSKESERQLSERNKDLEEQSWIKTQLTSITMEAQTSDDLMDLTKQLLSKVAKAIPMQHGAFYIREMNESGRFINSLKLHGSYAFVARKGLGQNIAFEEGIIGQCAYEQEPILLTGVPDDYVHIGSALGASVPKCILAQPIIFEKELVAVIEFASFEVFSKRDQKFVSQLADSLGVILNTIIGSQRTEKLLEESKTLTQKLTQQQSEMEQANEELRQKTEKLQESEHEMKTQQEELKAINEELEIKSKSLEEQQEELKESNREIEKTKKDIEEKASELEAASQYKSQFMANMSHELRTPLNSLLLLSGKLKTNEDGNLTGDQVEMMDCIHRGGEELLYLINDILDLSKVESGMMDINSEPFALPDVAESMEANFKQLAENKGVKFTVECDQSLPELTSDSFRLEQILKNLLSNAFKFTSQGEVFFKIGRANQTEKFSVDGLSSENVVAFVVKDTGIGIPQDKQKLIFDAFKQVDGSTSREYGGTGLGLSISLELTKLLGGEIKVSSEVDKGSTFTLFLPAKAQARPANTKQVQVSLPQNAVARPQVEKSSHVILIAENDNETADSLVKFVNGQGYEAVLSTTHEQTIEYSRTINPSAIIINGTAYQDTVNALKGGDIPVHVLNSEANSTGEPGQVVTDFVQALKQIEYVLDANVNHVLVAEDNPTTLMQVRESLSDENTVIDDATSGKQAIDKLLEGNYDCFVLDFHLPDMEAIELLRRASSLPDITLPPVVINTCRELTNEECRILQHYTNTIVIKGPYSGDRLSKEVSHFIHKLTADGKDDDVQDTPEIDDISLKGKTILIVDDDLKNTLALSTVMKKYDLNILIADNGNLAFERIEKNDNIDLILMDVMMPVKDGFETIRDIRNHPIHKSIPIIALTANTGRDVKTKCLELGANDFMTKPVDVGKLMPIIKLWVEANDK